MMEIFIIVLFLVLAAEFINGWTDAPNAIATVVSTGVMPPQLAVPMAVILNTVGAMAGTAVAATIGKGIVATSAVTVPAIGAAMVSIIAWGGFAAWRGIPVSKSHALIAGIAGAGIAGGGFEALLLGGWKLVAIGLVASIGIGFIASYLISKMIIVFAGRASPSRAKIVFDRLQIVSAGFMAFNHGMNDGQKFIGVFTLVLVLNGTVEGFNIPWWVILLCAGTMGIGTAMGGWRIISTVGKKLTTIKSWQGFAAETSASCTIFGASLLGIPLSTTHTITSAIAGAGSSRRRGDVRWGVMVRILYAWVLTFPCCGLIAFAAATAANFLLR